jgi:hypothetical protein
VVPVAKYIGDISTGVVHIDESDCPEISKIAVGDRILFKTLEDATEAGYSECSICFLGKSE